MSTKITHALIRDVREHNRQQWHDQAWWDFQRRPDVEAVQYAINNREYGDRDADIKRKAEGYLA